VSGASWLTTFLRITLRWATCARVVALWIAIHAMRSLQVPMFLTTQGNEVLAMLLWTYGITIGEAVLLYLVVCVVLSLGVAPLRVQKLVIERSGTNRCDH